ncbi:unnamed protein product [Polarella glacialis]|uniref:Uncharacterized protein n=1 Tax=Polarella glacialis TaxID=89957 RepID=A0A813DVV2_POLGL|nr:unnamed protein product [Polarella glacialis]CAE8589839.1 unnamed protein product [Polarella glacialis]CAE8622869.1 unnamed protein product [Polarella glacialis]
MPPMAVQNMRATMPQTAVHNMRVAIATVISSEGGGKKDSSSDGVKSRVSTPLRARLQRALGAFEPCLAELRAALADAAVPRAQRQEAIEALSAPLRAELLKLMTAEAKKKAQAAKQQAEQEEEETAKKRVPSGDPEEAATSASAESAAAPATEAPTSAARPLPPAASPAAVPAADASCARGIGRKLASGQRRLARRASPGTKPRPLQSKAESSAAKSGLWTVVTPHGRYHSARLAVGGVIVTSRATRCPREAQRLQLAVQRLQALASGSTPLSTSVKQEGGDGNAAVAFQARFRDAVSAVGCDDLGLTFRLVLDLRPWVGKKVQSPPLPTVDAALALRQHLVEVVAGGWPALRKEWLAWMASERPRQRWRSCARSLDEAEAAVSAAEVAFVAARASSVEASRQRRVARVANSSSAKAIRACRSSAAKAIRASQAQARHLRDEANGGARAAQRIKRAARKAEMAFARLGRAMDVELEMEGRRANADAKTKAKAKAASEAAGHEARRSWTSGRFLAEGGSVSRSVKRQNTELKNDWKRQRCLESNHFQSAPRVGFSSTCTSTSPALPETGIRRQAPEMQTATNGQLAAGAPLVHAPTDNGHARCHQNAGALLVLHQLSMVCVAA